MKISDEIGEFEGVFQLQRPINVFLKQDNDIILLDPKQACVDASNALRFISVRPQNPFFICKNDDAPPLNAGLGPRFFK